MIQICSNWLSAQTIERKFASFTVACCERSCLLWKEFEEEVIVRIGCRFAHSRKRATCRFHLLWKEFEEEDTVRTRFAPVSVVSYSKDEMWSGEVRKRIGYQYQLSYLVLWSLPQVRELSADVTPVDISYWRDKPLYSCSPDDSQLIFILSVFLFTF